MSRLKDNYNQKIVPQLMNELKLNRMAVPKLQKVVVNVGIGQAKTNSRFKEAVIQNLETITGQKPAVKLARQAISGFKIRAGEEVGLTVTLRGDKMYNFVDKLANIALPRLRDFRGLNPKSFDQFGNFSLGIKEQLIFPEISHEKAELPHGLEVTFTIKSPSVEGSQKLLEAFGFPFRNDINPSLKEQNG